MISVAARVAPRSRSRSVLVALTQAVALPADATTSTKQQPATLRALDGLGRIDVESALRLKAKWPVVVTAGKYAFPRITLTNRTTAPVSMGSGAAGHFESVITDETGGVVGGTAVSGWIGVGRDYHPIAPKATLASHAAVAALGFHGLDTAAPPLAPGRYLLWVELPYIRDIAMRVAGPVPVTVR